MDGKLKDCTISIVDAGDYCLFCGGLIEDCKEDCPVLQMLYAEMTKAPEKREH